MSPFDPDQRFRDLPERDHYFVGKSGWIPETTIPALEEMRVEHERLVALYVEKSRAVSAIRSAFDAEDAAAQEALDAAYREGREPALPEKTDPAARTATIADAEGHATAANRALKSYAIDGVLARLRGELPDGYHAAHAANTREVPPEGDAARIVAEFDLEMRAAHGMAEEARRLADRAAADLRTLVPLRNWLVRTANAGIDNTPRLMRGADLVVPPAFTKDSMSKPRDLAVPGWYQDANGEGEEYEIEEGETIDQSDPWFAQQEAAIATREL